MLEDLISMKDEFLSTISHEFKTPLNVINSAIQAMELLCKDELTIKSRKYLKSIRQNTFRQLRLVNNIIDITKIQAGKMKIHKKNIDIVFISKSIVDSVVLYAKQKRIQLDFKTDISEKVIGIDDEKYERILLNLLSNAIKFTPEGKEITVNICLKKYFVRIEVIDKGLGIPKDKQKLIFERFGQVDSSLSRQAEGAGIGLSLVNGLVNALGGRISLKSEVGKGSNFVILLPNKKVGEDSCEQKLREISDNRLIQSIAIEFSDIYLG
jgi:two-component system sensor histidine kinase/response regulator